MNSKEAFGKLALMCSRKEYCISDIKKKVQFWKLSPSSIDEIIKQLIEENYLNEQRYTEAFVKDKFRFNKWGKQKISYQLKQKQISTELIELAFENISDSDYQEVIEQLLVSKNKSVKAESNYEKRGKLMRFLAQRGFEMDAMNKAFDRIDFEK